MSRWQFLPDWWKWRTRLAAVARFVDSCWKLSLEFELQLSQKRGHKVKQNYFRTVFTTKRFVKITHGNIVASHTLVLATPRFELNWVSKACVSIFPSTRGAHSADQCAVTVAWSVGGPDSRAELKTDLSYFAQFLRRKICVKNSKQNNIRKILWNRRLQESRFNNLSFDAKVQWASRRCGPFQSMLLESWWELSRIIKSLFTQTTKKR